MMMFVVFILNMHLNKSNGGQGYYKEGAGEADYDGTV
uniref:Uncharacterized protein n=1 Tax=Anguilla anguilla TaxID=7936 RepID=A0A0E9S203_ANGAN